MLNIRIFVILFSLNYLNFILFIVGYNRISKKNVAIKILNKKKLEEKNILTKVYKEIAINKELEHPHIVKLYDYFETDTDIYLVFEYVSGGELFEQISSHKIKTEEMARKYFQQLISAVDFVHKNGISHRDLKPENILLDQNGDIKILDFGFSNLIKDGRCLRTSWGSPNYAAPEVILSK